jgi:hypothetical protein
VAEQDRAASPRSLDVVGRSRQTGTAARCSAIPAARCGFRQAVGLGAVRCPRDRARAPRVFVVAGSDRRCWWHRPRPPGRRRARECRSWMVRSWVAGRNSGAERRAGTTAEAGHKKAPPKAGPRRNAGLQSGLGRGAQRSGDALAQAAPTRGRGPGTAAGEGDARITWGLLKNNSRGQLECSSRAGVKAVRNRSYAATGDSADSTEQMFPRASESQLRG